MEKIFVEEKGEFRIKFSIENPLSGSAGKYSAHTRWLVGEDGGVKEVTLGPGGVLLDGTVVYKPFFREDDDDE